MAYVLGFLSLVALFLPFKGFAEGEAIRPYEVTEDREVCKDYEPLRRPFFGDTHVHTTYSFDANGQACTQRDAGIMGGDG